MTDPAGPTQLLVVGGASGTGKTSVALEVSALLRRERVAHAYVDGDNLDASYPAPGDVDREWFTPANLRKVWDTYRAAGQRRLVYVNTVSVLETEVLAAAVGGDVEVVAVLLAADPSSVHERLRGRERGSELAVHVERSDVRRAELEAKAPGWVHRVDTTGRTVGQVAADVLATSGWAAARDGVTDPDTWV
ncbi:adenylyl-sulfate kinase [Sanguibacter sp. 25GB23B1]|uniref:adenylyl-sulfate kinase n=1 Tax=unclassified Sanguibacter TaxID=2645534 RepID=UPI0032AFA2D1